MKKDVTFRVRSYVLKRQRGNADLIRRETIHQTVAAGAFEVGLRAAAVRSARSVRTVPGFRRVVVAQADAVGMADDRRALRAARPVLAGTVVAGGECGAVRLRSRDYVVAVRRIEATVDDLALLAQRGLLGEIVRAVQLGDILGDHDAFGILPRPLADSVARIHRRLAVGRLRREISAPGFCAGTRRLRQGLAMIVGAGKTAEAGTIADAVAGHEESGVGRLRLRGLRGHHRERSGRGDRKACARDKVWHLFLPFVFLIRRLDQGGQSKMKRRRGVNRSASYRSYAADDQVCWIAESSQSSPRRRTKVHTSVASVGCSLPPTRRPVVRSSVLSTSEKRIATLA